MVHWLPLVANHGQAALQPQPELARPGRHNLFLGWSIISSLIHWQPAGTHRLPVGWEFHLYYLLRRSVSVYYKMKKAYQCSQSGTTADYYS